MYIIITPGGLHFTYAYFFPFSDNFSGLPVGTGAGYGAVMDLSPGTTNLRNELFYFGSGVGIQGYAPK